MARPPLSRPQHAERRHGDGRRRGLPALHRHRQLVHRRRLGGELLLLKQPRGRGDLGGRSEVAAAVLVIDATGHSGAAAAAAGLLLHGDVEHQFQNVLRGQSERERKKCAIDDVSVSEMHAGDEKCDQFQV